MVRLKRIGVLSLAKLQALLYGFVGVIAGILYAIGQATSEDFALSPDLCKVIGFSVIVLPVAYATFGFILGIIAAFLYNRLAGWIGGLEMEFEQ